MKIQNSKFKIQKRTALAGILLLTFNFSLLTCSAQQTPQYTQFMLNNYGMNPAAAGVSNNKYEALAGVRRQWIGFENAPSTEFFNVTTYYGNKNSLTHGWHGVGAYWQGDRLGSVIATDDFYASYTYLMRIYRKGFIAFGMASGARRYNFGLSQISFDPAVNSKHLWLYPDFIPGIKFWNNKWSFDLSVKQLYKYNLKQGGDMIGTPGTLPPHFYFAATRKWWPLSYLLVLQSLHVKYNFATLPSFDYTLLAYLNKYFAVGLSYRHFDAIAGIVQFRFDKLVIGFAYDYTIAPYRLGFANSQEVMLGLSPSPYSDGADNAKHYRTAECPTFQY
ncbi:MAG: PorP/SprF family type IX secretion system membrane protein [Bacteroidetes bacterium]|nr:PorP/SprF family type IX secretion system membrane protein [Bacteroidota bacterium]